MDAITPVPTPTPAPEVTPKAPSFFAVNEKRPVHVVFALFAIAAAYLFISMVPIDEVPLGTLVYAVVLFGGTLVYALLTGARLRFDAVLSMLLGLLFSSFYYLGGFVAYANEYYPAFLLTTAAYLYFVFTLFGNRKSNFFGALMALEWFQAAVLNPFRSFPALFAALLKGSGKKRKVRWKAIAFPAIGVVLAILLGAMVVNLLSFDPNFAALGDKLKNLFTDRFWDDLVFDLMKLVFFAIPAGALLFGAAWSSRKRALPNFAKKETAMGISEKTKVLPIVIAAIPTALLLVIYGLFFITQMPYYLSAFSHVLPEAYSAADYARNGFFELCGVAAINAALALVLNGFSKRAGKAASVCCKLLTLLLSLETLILIATALSKLFLYIERFDLTLARLWPTFFLVLLAVAFVTLIVSTLIRRVKLLPVVLTVCVLFAAAYPCCNVKGLVARYNVDAYLARTERSEDAALDARYLASLGEAAIPELVRAYEDPRTDAATRDAIRNELTDFANEVRYNPLRRDTNATPSTGLFWEQKSIFSNKNELLLKPFHQEKPDGITSREAF